MNTGRCVLGDGTVHYYNEKGILHREDGPAIEYCHSTQGGGTRWYYEGQKHRIGGPAVIHADGTTEWWENGQRHRLDGPAVRYGEGPEFDKWFYRGKHIKCSSLEEFQRIVNLKVFW